MAVEPKRHLFSVDQYERMVKTGVLTEDDRVELIEGEIVEMPPIDPQHSIPVQRLNRIFIERLGPRAYVRVQDAVRLPPRSEPEPDVVVALPPDTRYLSRHPQAEDILLVIEVAYTTKHFDRNRKLPMYARQRIPEVWIVDVPASRIEVYRAPEGDSFATVEIVARGGSVSPEAFPDVQIAIDEVLP